MLTAPVIIIERRRAYGRLLFDTDNEFVRYELRVTGRMAKNGYVPWFVSEYCTIVQGVSERSGNARLGVTHPNQLVTIIAFLPETFVAYQRRWKMHKMEELRNGSYCWY